MATNALKSQTLTIKVGDASPGTYNLVGEITDFSLYNGTGTIIDATHLQSAAREKIMGLPDLGGCTLTVNFDPTDTNGQNRCQTLLDNQTLGYFEVTYTDSPATVDTFTAFVTQFTIDGSVDDKINGTITLEVSGAKTRV